LRGSLRLDPSKRNRLFCSTRFNFSSFYPLQLFM
jgi:hypothetical protein